MKKILFVIFVLVSFNLQAQLKVKDGSFVHNPNAVMDDKHEHIDAKGLPMALLKISTENISEQERKRLKFERNECTQITTDYKTGQVWVYIPAENAKYINITHPDYNPNDNPYRYYFPEKLHGFSIYELVLQYVPKVESQSMIVVDCSPQAYAYIDGKSYGKTPIVEDISVGEHVLTLKLDGYEELKKSFAISEGEDLILNETLQAKSPSVITIKCTPQADVYIDGKLYGKTPINENISVGKHTLILKKEGYEELRKNFTVLACKELTLNETLQVISSNVIIESTPQVYVYIDGKPYGQTPLNTNISVGKHTLTLKKEGYAELKKNFIVKSGEDLTLKENLQVLNQTISISSNQKGDKVYLDGKKVGKTPMSLNVSFGSHKVEVKKGDRYDMKTINVAQNGITSYSFNPKNSFNPKITGEIINGLSLLMAICSEDEYIYGLSYDRIHLNKKGFGIGWFVDGALNLESFSAIGGVSLFFPKTMMNGTNCLRLGAGVGCCDDLGLDLLMGFGGIIGDEIYSLDLVLGTYEYIEIRVTFGLTW